MAGAGIIALVTAAFVPFSAWSITTATTGIENNTPVAAAAESKRETKAPESVDDLYPVIKQRWSGSNFTAITNESEASSLAGFDVKFPTRMPSSDYKLQLGIVNRETGDNNKYVFLYCSEKPVTDDMTFNQFWEQGGISVTYHKNATSYVNEYDGNTYTSYSNITAMYEIVVHEYGFDAHLTNVNGHQAIAIADVHREFVPEPYNELEFAVHDPAQVDFVAGNTYVTLQGYKDADELVRIAESIPFDAE
ncbi:hypothetical protein [Candidatus Nitrososphaera evergladensis]|uniref:hypothetical protein n=1 Tax=Candidatus Nitrososphaera evergladensis TaxID=1459637 RepID=UPI0011E5C26B|nr:hypothetical protein [Candidatus Nitrososphaera evergladensis]